MLTDLLVETRPCDETDEIYAMYDAYYDMDYDLPDDAMDRRIAGIAAEGRHYLCYVNHYQLLVVFAF